ncbi:AGE family epimerase/isomerase [Bdellovibrio bacteriovorus]|uniref:AGE family epimerase/isomerase n=1 Tax=Bdellovibrio bacteriovorus TaxID=959 RepID=UPI003AA9B289
MVENCKNWLSKDVLPLWLNKGVDWERGGFVESFSLEGEPQDVPRRSMVQARQIYSLRLGMELGLCDQEKSRKAIDIGAAALIRNYSLPSGGFIHSATKEGEAKNTTPDLYAQAFALFGLAHAYAVNPLPEYKERSRQLVQYLYSERHLSQGGFTELTDKGVQYEANPHMHMFESAVAWMAVDSDPLWKKLADEILNLCLTKFIDPKSGTLAEHFNADWSPILENGKFVFEPGHQYEWAWLMGLYQGLTGKDLTAVRENLIVLSEKHGIWNERKSVIDEVWSDLSAKTKTSRFWPQCERIKAVLQMGLEKKDQRAQYAQAADEAMATLFKFFETPQKGLWFDTWQESGEFRIQPAKASSLYHIIGAINEYVRYRPKL